MNRPQTYEPLVLVALLLSAVLSSGCMAFWSRTEYGVGTNFGKDSFVPVYSGLAQAVHEASDTPDDLLILFDLPFTLALDTILLPLDLVWWAAGWDGRRRPERKPVADDEVPGG